MWKIGNLNIDGQAVLGPMSGYTSAAYREFMRPFGVSLSFTEMISDKGVIFGDKETKRFLSFQHTHPTGIQLFGSNPDEIAKAAELSMTQNPDIDLIDVNMGCPVKKIIRGGSGSALMKDPMKCGDIIRKIKEKVNVPVTAKIRLGIARNNMNFREIIGELTDADVDAISLHVRTQDEHYAGIPDYEIVRDLQSEMSVPLIISGNIYSVESAAHASEITGAAAVMVARGGVGNPYLVTQIDNYFRTGKVLQNPTINEQIDWCLQLTDMIINEFGEETGIRKMRSYAPKFISGCFGSKVYRNKLATETYDKECLIQNLEKIREKIGDRRIYARKYDEFEYES